ncbi:MAG: DciA family protein [Hyphomicrobiales bacterium]|nr:DciA family protein [Hyphomicrobiales bacterium]
MAGEAGICGKVAEKGARQPFRGGSPRRVGEFVPAVSRPAFERYGFASAEIIANWAQYAGADIAACAAPERLKWPRNEEGGATLILRVDGARALDVQYKTEQLLQRLNAAFGYRAITAVRLVQAPAPAKKPAVAAPQPPTSAQFARVDHVGDDKLRHALARIAAGIEARGVAHGVLMRAGG